MLSLSWMPEGIIVVWVYTVLCLGLAGTAASFVLNAVPLIGQYRLIVRMLSIIMLALGLYWLGGLDVRQQWRAQVQEMQQRVAVAEQQAAQRNVEIQQQVVERTRVIREKGKNIVNYIDREVVKKEEVVRYVEKCPIPQVILETHNAAAQLDQAEPTK